MGPYLGIRSADSDRLIAMCGERLSIETQHDGVFASSAGSARIPRSAVIAMRRGSVADPPKPSRYECLDLTLALAIALIGLGRYQLAALLGTALLPLVAFGVFLKLHGLPALPLSVLMKGGMSSYRHTARLWVDLYITNL